MRGVIRKGVDKSTGHCFTPRPCITGSKNVLVNNIPVTRSGDYYPKHCCGKKCHDGRAVSKSNVFVNNKPIHISGDQISCGDTAFHGSPNVFVN
jgi:uncharacterized Zn-binding protein involved in type VI secretion